jgi:hypothetical protein
MNKPQQELLDEAYEKYADSHFKPPSNPKGKLLSDQLFSVVPIEHSKESFINTCKTNPKFSKKWGLKIEERELSLEERSFIANSNHYERIVIAENSTEIIPGFDSHFDTDEDVHKVLDTWNTPTKLITITYNDKTITSYE